MSQAFSTPIAIRVPLLIRVYVVAFGVFWIAVVAWTTIVRQHGASAVIGAVFIVFGAALLSRAFVIGVHSEPGGILAVRNNLGTRRFARHEIEQFRLGVSGGTRLGRRTIQVLLRDGTTYGLDVCRTPFGLGSARMSSQLATLNGWLQQDR